MRNRNMKHFLSAAVLATALLAAPVALPHSAFAQNAPAPAGSSSVQGAQNFVANMGQQALNFLRDPGMGQTSKEDAFRQLLESSFDMPTIAKFTLGQYYRQLSPQQQTDYENLFREWVVKIYSSRFSQYKGQTFNVVNAQPSPDTPTDTIVHSSIVDPNGGQPVNVDWRVRNAGHGYHIVDVLVEGVSMSQTQRSDFAAVIQRHGGNPAALLDDLHRQVAGGGMPQQQ
jgi:phospholipid transport system substrate-binding protein